MSILTKDSDKNTNNIKPHSLFMTLLLFQKNNELAIYFFGTFRREMKRNYMHTFLAQKFKYQ